MPVPVLLVATATLWLGAARIPRALTRAGFEVSLLAPRGALAEASRHVRRIHHLPEDADGAAWALAFTQAVETLRPRIVVPTDDMAFRLLQMLVAYPPPGASPALHLQLAALVRESLGDPTGFLPSADKTLLSGAAAALGVPVVPFVVVAAPAEAEDFVAEHGYPLVVTGGVSTAGSGVAICADHAALQRAFVELAVPAPAPARWLVQKGIAGRRILYPVAAWQGRLLAGWASEKLVAGSEPKGVSTVVRRFRDPACRAIAARLVEGFGMSGLLSVELAIEERTGEPLLIEINRRVPPGIHLGAQFGVDLCAALLAAIEGRPCPTGTNLADTEDGVNVHFPQELLRDPASRWLRDYPVDVPWDEPELLEALLALRHRA